MKNITTWRPDTCGCVLQYEWDTEVPAEERTHTMHSISKCPAHAHLPDHEAFMEATEENKHKNILKDEIMNHNPHLRETVVNEQGEEVVQYKKGHDPDVLFDSERNIDVRKKRKDLEIILPDESLVQSRLEQAMSDMKYKVDGVQYDATFKSQKGKSTRIKLQK